MGTPPGAVGVTQSEPLLLGEMFAPALAAALRADLFDVVAVADSPMLLGLPQEAVATWAAGEGRRVVTENVKDFALLAGHGDPSLRVLLTSSRRFPRSRRNPGPLTEVLRRWLTEDCERADVEWLR